jgi:hypothetical protein
MSDKDLAGLLKVKNREIRFITFNGLQDEMKVASEDWPPGSECHNSGPDDQ